MLAFFLFITEADLILVLFCGTSFTSECILFVDVRQSSKLMYHGNGEALLLFKHSCKGRQGVIQRSHLGGNCAFHLFNICRMLQIKLDQPVSDPASPREISNGDTATNISTHIQTLRSEVTRLRNQLAISEQESKYNLESFLMWD
jgi:hypothetical protein